MKPIKGAWLWADQNFFCIIAIIVSLLIGGKFNYSAILFGVVLIGRNWKLILSKL